MRQLNVVSPVETHYRRRQFVCFRCDRRFRAAAEHNHAGAQYGLGYMHLAGHGVAMDHRKAYKYFSSAAEQVRPQHLVITDIQVDLSSVAVDNRKACQYLFSAAEQVRPICLSSLRQHVLWLNALASRGRTDWCTHHPPRRALPRHNSTWA